MLKVGGRVRILVGEPGFGTIYDHYPRRIWSWHVRRDGTPEMEAGTAYSEEELECIIEDKNHPSQDET